MLSYKKTVGIGVLDLCIEVITAVRKSRWVCQNVERMLFYPSFSTRISQLDNYSRVLTSVRGPRLCGMFEWQDCL